MYLLQNDGVINIYEGWYENGGNYIVLEKE
jgi:hypothetical protein